MKKGDGSTKWMEKKVTEKKWAVPLTRQPPLTPVK